MSPGADPSRRAPIPTALEFSAGFLLVLLVLSDVFRTILLPRPTNHALRLGPIIGAALVPLWLHLAGRIRSKEARQTFRGSLGPLLLVLSLLVWVALLLFGFALMLHAVGDRIQPAATFGDALYYVGSCFATLGVSEATVSGSARGVLVAAGLSGLTVVTMLVTFLLTVQEALHRREVLVLSIEMEAGRPPSGVAILETYGRTGLIDGLADLFPEWDRWAADVLHSHRANPVLAHFRSADEDGEWLAALGAVLDAASLLVSTVQERQAPKGAAAAKLLLPIGCRMACDLAGVFRVDVDDGPPGETSEREFHDARRRLAAAGYALVPDEAAALACFRELRADYEPSLVALARSFGILLPRSFDQDTHPAVGDIIERTRPGA